MDEFEQFLKKQPLRTVPPEWRTEVLTAATATAGRGRACPEFVEGNAVRRSGIAWWRELLWPSQTAWAGLAVVWILIFAIDLSVRDKSPALAKKSSPPSPEVIVELQQQRLLLAELIGSRNTSDADRSKPLVPQPRSERQVEILMT